MLFEEIDKLAAAADSNECSMVKHCHLAVTITNQRSMYFVFSTLTLVL